MIQESINEIISQQDDVEAVFNAITMQFGPDTVLAAKIKLKPGISIDSAVADINELERKLKERIPGLRWCFIEPDITD